MTATPSSTFARKGRLAACAVVLLSAVSLAACAKRVDPYETTGALPGDFRSNHPITLEEKIATLDIPVSVDTARLSEGQRANIGYFAQSFLSSGSAIIAVVAPSGSPNQVAAASIAVEVENALVGAGVSPRAVSYRVYKAEKSEITAPVRVAFNRVVASTTPCGPYGDQLSVNASNENYEAFGCVTQQNLAAMVENPLDLLYPRGLTPADASRRATVLEKYRLGEQTGATVPGNEGGTSSGVGN